MTITLKKYVRHEDRSAFEAVGWKEETPLDHPMMHESVLMTRDFDETSRERISVTTANLLPNGEIEIIAVISGEEKILVAARNVAQAFSANIGRALSER